MESQLKALPVAVLGAGPVGLAAAAHLINRGFAPLIFEAGNAVAANLESFRHVRLFSPWRYNVDTAARELLTTNGWHAPDEEELPTAGEIIDAYLQPLANLPQIASQLRLNHRVVQITRQGQDKVKTAGRESLPFALRIATSSGEQEFLAQAVIDATGTWSQPNPLGANGVPALGEIPLAAHIAYGMPDILGKERRRYAGRRTLVVGAGHSAVGNLIALVQLSEQVPDTRIVWTIRGNSLDKSVGGGAADKFPARGLLGIRLKELHEAGRFEVVTSFRIREVRRQENSVEVLGEPVHGKAPAIAPIDQIIGATGARPNLEMARELRLKLDPWLESTEALAPLIDPNLHSCGTVRPHGYRVLAHPDAGYYAVGAKSYGRAPNFLMATGYEQVRSVAAALAGDFAAADDVRLELPETGVCTVRGLAKEAGIQEGGCCAAPSAQSKASVKSVEEKGKDGCCGGKAPEGSNACCALDATEKTKGKTGCGCNATKPTSKPATVASCCS